jgi:hypothetical protein
METTHGERSGELGSFSGAATLNFGKFADEPTTDAADVIQCRCPLRIEAQARLALATRR